MSRHPVSLLLSAVAWVGFVVVTLWTMAFLAGVVVPRTVDGPARTSHRASRWPSTWRSCCCSPSSTR